MLDRELARNQIKETCGNGWLFLVDIIYDDIPPNLTINEVFQKWAGLEVRFDGFDKKLLMASRKTSSHFTKYPNKKKKLYPGG